MMTTIAVSLSLLAIFATGTPSVQKVSEADSLIAQAMSLRRQELHEQAFELFRRAHEQAPCARTRAQMGLALQSLKRWVASETNLVAALQSSKDRWIRRNRAPLEQALRHVMEHIGEIAISGTAGAEIYANGVAQGTLPLPQPLRFGDGNVVVQVNAPGYQPLVTTVAVAGKKRLAIAAELEPAPAAAAAPLAPSAAPTLPLPISGPAPAGFDRAPPSPGDEVMTLEDWSEPSVNWSKTIGTALLVASAAAAIGGLVALAADGEPVCDAPSNTPCPVVRDSAGLGWTLLGAGAAGALTGGGLLFWGSQIETPDGSSGTNSAFSVGIRARGRF